MKSEKGKGEATLHTRNELLETSYRFTRVLISIREKIVSEKQLRNSTGKF